MATKPLRLSRIAAQRELTLADLRRALLVALVAVLVGLALHSGGVSKAADNFYYDVWHHIAGKRREAQHVVIISVDNETFLRLRDDPLAFWQPHFAKVMKVLEDAGASVIGLDFIYATSAETWLSKFEFKEKPGEVPLNRVYDASFRERLSEGQKILVGHVLPADRDEAASGKKGKVVQVLPPDEHLFSLPDGYLSVGMANLASDKDNLVRTFVPVLDAAKDVPGIGFSTQLAIRAAKQKSDADSWQLGGETLQRADSLRTIGYVGPAGSIPRISMNKLIDRPLSREHLTLIKGRVALITAHDSSSLQDTHLTPYARGFFNFNQEQMTGGEVHANITETLLSGIYPRSLPWWVLAMALLACVTPLALIIFRMHPGWAIGTTFIGACVVAALGYVAFKGYWILPVGTLQIALSMVLLATLALRLTGAERSRRQLRAMFGNYVSDEVVELLTSQASEGKRPNLGGEEMVVSILFSDIRDFTTISEKLDAHEVVEMLNAYFAKACEPILKERGNVNKYIGDAVMAMFGSPYSYDDHAERALKAAVGMAKAAEEFRGWMEQRFPNRGLPEFRIGIGVHTGVVVSGSIGTDKRREFTVIGDAVNTASRLEGMSKTLGWTIVASRASAEAAKVEIGETNSITVKGRAQSVEVVEIQGLSAQGALVAGGKSRVEKAS
jgi:adenylate cyclase